MIKQIEYIDTHCHLISEYYDNIEQIVDDCLNENVIKIFNIGTNDEEFKEVITVCNKYNNVYGIIGYYPTNIDKIDNLENLEVLLKHPKIIGLGEIGLDYYNVDNNHELQKKLFSQQLALAEKYNLKVVIHSREAMEDTYNILTQYKVSGIIHCYSGSVEMAKRFIKLGFCLGIGGSYTFKNNKKGISVLEEVDLSNLVLETDAPYLTPEPYRGRKNSPVMVREVAKKIAEVKNLSIEEVASATTNNALGIFKDILITTK